MRQPFTYFKRDKARYYVQRWNSDLGKYSTAVSTGQTSKAAAMAWVKDASERGVFESTRRIKTDFASFASNFYTPDSEFILHRARDRKRMGLGHMKNQQTKVDKYLIPFFGTRAIHTINKNHILELKTSLIAKHLSNQTIDQALYALKGILEWAMAKDVITHLPDIRFCKDYSQSKARGILEVQEVQRLLALPNWEEVHHLIATLAFTTGMRQGEILALQWEKVNLEKETIEVSASWDRAGSALKCTKTRKSRVVPLAPTVIRMLKVFKENSAPITDKALLFAGQVPGQPLDRKYVERVFHKTLLAININEATRRTRNIVFHSSRHFFNSYLLNNGIPQVVVQSILGHTVSGMTANYYHQDELPRIKELTEGLLK